MNDKKLKMSFSRKNILNFITFYLLLKTKDLEFLYMYFEKHLKVKKINKSILNLFKNYQEQLKKRYN